MSRFARMAGTSVGGKTVVAITGLALFLFVIAHLLGNLTLLAGRDAMNGYAEKLKSLGPLLWVMRGGLLAFFLTHVALAVKLNRESKAARPVAYAKEATLKATWASRQMVLTGLVVLAFVVYHLLHFTLHVFPPGIGPEAEGGRPDVYGMVVAGFSSAPVAIAYVIANALLGLHLVHGSRSLFQTLGLDQVSIAPAVNGLAPALAIFVAGGNMLLPLTVLFGWVS
ncbi:MAG: succinate dehydrogenase cytochrome b subunit [Planctomycetota bacterium]|jgi:succinate dehydrogenase / fumarate reductase cytochrome b subunit